MFEFLLSPNGRVSRGAFWGVNVVFAIIILALAWLLFQHTTAIVPTVSGGYIAPSGSPDIGHPFTIALLLAIPMLWIEFCLIVKRWHDRGKSGWWSLIILLPVLGLIWAFIEVALLRGQPGGNRYGGSTSWADRRGWTTDDIYAEVSDDMP